MPSFGGYAIIMTVTWVVTLLLCIFFRLNDVQIALVLSVPVAMLVLATRVLEVLRRELREREEQIELHLRLLKISESKYQSLFEGAPAAYVSLNEKGNILECNAAAQQLLGLSADQLRGKNFYQFLPEAQRPNDELTFRALLQRGGPPLDTERSLVLEGLEKTVTLQVIPVTESGDDPTRFRVVLFDVTERRRIEKQLMRSQKLESLGRLAGGIAHDFNNELSGILGYASLLKSKLPKESPHYGHVETLEQGAQRAARIIKQLLTLARHQDFKPEMVQFNSCAERALQFVRGSIPAHINTHLKLCPLNEPLPGDAVNIEQILINLILNARDSMRDSGNITLKTELLEFRDPVRVASGEIRPGTYLKCSVSDDGSGMTNQAKEHLFEPFFSTKGVGKGTGLGLAMVYQIMLRHKGFIDYESEWRKGTSFHLYFPFVRQDTTTEVSAIDQQKRIRKKKIMVVDDETAIRELAKTVLQDAGYEIVEVADGQEAVEFFSHTDRPPIDLVIMDMVMPRKDGVEAYHEIRKMDPLVPIIFSSGYVDTEQTRKARTLGLSIALPKPYRIEQLLDVTEHHIRKERDPGNVARESSALLRKPAGVAP